MLAQPCVCLHILVCHERATMVEGRKMSPSLSIVCVRQATEDRWVKLPVFRTALTLRKTQSAKNALSKNAPSHSRKHNFYSVFVSRSVARKPRDS